jgi:two-component system response regulator HydG
MLDERTDVSGGKPDMSETTNPAKVLVVDDEAIARSALLEMLRDEGYEVRAAADGFKALGALDRFTPDVLITDVNMPGMDGVELMTKLKDRLPELGVIVMTAFGSVQSAVDAIHLGADDYITKPLEVAHLLDVLERVISDRESRAQADELREALARDDIGDTESGLIGRSRAFRELLEVGRQVAVAPTPILVTGESGTGKGLVARALHRWGGLEEGPFITVACGGGDASALRLELFGGDGNAGKMHEASGGTLFLDEIGALPREAQALLTKKMRENRLEATADRPAARIIASTERDLRDEIRAGRFTEALLYQLNVISLHVPTLSERREDIPLLAAQFLRDQTRTQQKTILDFDDRALGVLSRFDWPGNVRQLENAIAHAVARCPSQRIEPRHLPRELMSQGAQDGEAPKVPGASMREIERWAILSTLESVGGSTSKAASILGISPRKIQYRLNEYRDHDPSNSPAIADTN